MKFDYIMMMIWGFIVCINLAAHNWPAAFNAGVVIFYLFVIDHLKKQIEPNEIEMKESE